MKLLMVAFALIILAFAIKVKAMPADAMSTPSIEFECKGLRGVVFKDNGDLDINGKTFKLNGSTGSTTLHFDNKVSLIGEREGDNLILDNATIIYQGEKYRCNAQ